MALSRTHVWSAGEVLTAIDLNAEFNAILNGASVLVSPFTQAISMGGFALNFDAANTIALTGATNGIGLTGGTLREPAEDSITAFATGGQASATALSAAKKYHRISVCATANDSVALPASTAGQAHYIRNDGVASCQVYGMTPDTINGIATATGVTLPAGAATWYVCTTAGNWTTSLFSTGNLTGGVNEKITTIASATTPDIFALTVGNVVNYTGVATATGFVAAPQAGARRVLVCAGAAVFTAGANMLIQGVPSGSNYTAVAGDMLQVTAITTTQFRLMILPVTGIPGKQPTRTVLTSGTAATYTTPLGATRINVKMVGGGGGGGGSGTSPGAAGAGTASTWSGGSLSAGGGSAGISSGNGNGVAGGSSSNGDINLTGGGSSGPSSSTSQPGGNGGISYFGGAGQNDCNATTAGANAVTNSGSGGSGASCGATPNAGSGGGAGGYCEKLITAPAATYTYTVGAKGTGGTLGTSGAVGGDGAAGIIIVDEYYN